MKSILFALAYVFRLLDVNSGLPENNVRNMTMLPSGMMCIQTSSVLSLYDGARMTSYSYDPGRVPYSEYSGMNEAWYDPGADRIWCKAKDRLWIFNPGTGTFDYDSAGALERLGINPEGISGFYIDSSGILWMTSEDGSLWKKPLSEETQATKATIPCKADGVLMERRGDKLFLLTSDGSLIEYSVGGNGVSRMMDLGERISSDRTSHIEMSVAADDRVWVMTDHRIMLVDPGKRSTATVLEMPESSSDLFTSICADKDGKLWAGSARSGVSIIDPTTLATENLPSLKLSSSEEIYHHTDISKVYSDPKGGIWISTLTEGLLYCYPGAVRFENINHGTVSSGQFADEGVKCLLEDRDGTILVGTIKGLLRYDPRSGALSVPWRELADELVISLYRDGDGRLWAGTFYDGAYCICGASGGGNSGVTGVVIGGTVRHFSYASSETVDVSYQENKPNRNCVRCFFEDSKGVFWASVYGGLGRMDRADGSISLLRETHPELNAYMIIRSICEISPGVLLASGDNGSFTYDSVSDRVLSSDVSASGNMTVVDRRGLIWSSDRNGMVVREAPGADPMHFGALSQIAGNSVMSIVEDDSGNIWVASYGHVFCIRVSGSGPRYEVSVVRYGKEDGIGAGSFFQNSVLKHSDGKIYFGGVRGIASVQPSAVTPQEGDFPPVVLSYSADGKISAPAPEKGIRIRYNEVPLEISFSSFDLANAGHVLYSYKLEGFDRDWQNIPSGELPSARYSYIRPGEYVFLLRSCSPGGEWSQTSVPVRVKPHILASKPAFAVYALIAGFIVMLVVIFFRKREKKRMEEQMEEERKNRKEELDQMKFRFFTNISHELRTPLSLIMLPLQSLMKESDDERLVLIKKNAGDLLDLVNHLLDFRKLEMGGEKLSLGVGNISELVCSVADKFRDAFREKKIMFEVSDECPDTIMAFDSSKVKKIVSNLLSNALKFTPEGGYVSLKQNFDGNDFVLEVSDTGKGMTEEDTKMLFERFYRSPLAGESTGSGIGLNLVKQYVDMMAGKIEVSSQLGKGSCFRIHLSSTLEAPQAEPQGRIVMEGAADAMTGVAAAEGTAIAMTGGAAAEGTAVPEGVRILLVDDNRTFREYVAGELSRLYRVIQAEDGRKALDALKETDADIIVSDVMMPGMDGLELTARIKGNIDTSHIPVILLTARQSDEVRLEGYETGADAYLTKPFQMDMLLARINNLLEERRRRLHKFATSPEYSPTDVTVTTLDQKFMQKIMESVERNMANCSYSVEMLAEDVGMHRMNLYRKLQAITGEAPLEFIRSMRLKRAAQLLSSDPGLYVNEVAEMVGFSTTKYFSKYFKDMFGVSPSQYIRK